MKEKETLAFLLENPAIEKIVGIIADLQLPEAYLCAGTLRNYIWDSLSHKEHGYPSDVDVIYFDPSSPYEESVAIQKRLSIMYPAFQWEVKNQCYMHIHSYQTSPYTSSFDALSKYPERCTAIALGKQREGKYQLLTPHGVDDLWNMVVQPTLHFRSSPQRMEQYRQRQRKKAWQNYWPELQIYDLEN